MKKEENQKRNIALKNEYFTRARSLSPKAYYGCDTCKLRNANSRFSECDIAQEKCKVKKSPNSGRDERGLKDHKIKLTDLCDEDKKRLVELIEELSKLAERNEKLKEKLDHMHKNEQQQKDYIVKQANAFLEEKNFYINEINAYKSRLEALESEMKNKISEWKDQGRCKDNEIAYLGRVLQKTMKEKNELHEEMNHLKVSLKHSLESFQKLKTEVTKLQYKEQELRKYKAVCCQTEIISAPKEKHKGVEEDTDDEEYLSTYNQESVNAKSSLDIINDKLENVYQLLKRRRESLLLTPKQRYDSSVPPGNDEKLEDVTDKSKSRILTGTDDAEKSDCEDGDYKFIRPFDEHHKTSVHAERILRNLGKTLQLNVNETIENNLGIFKSKESSRDGRNLNFLQNKIVQKNNFFKSSETHQYDEDRLLEELFYSDQSTHLGLEPRLETKKMNKFHPDPFPY